MKKNTCVFILILMLMISTTTSAHYIGEYYQGGIVFWIDDKDEHGLIASIEDQEIDVPWFNKTYVMTYAIRDGIFAGKINTDQIVNVQGAPVENYAASIAKNYMGGGYNDWYLPSRYELNLMFSQKDIIGGFHYTYMHNNYWSSTEYPSNRLLGACIQSESKDHQFVSLKEGLGNVRAIRSF